MQALIEGVALYCSNVAFVLGYVDLFEGLVVYGMGVCTVGSNLFCSINRIGSKE